MLQVAPSASMAAEADRSGYHCVPIEKVRAEITSCSLPPEFLFGTHLHADRLYEALPYWQG